MSFMNGITNSFALPAASVYFMPGTILHFPSFSPASLESACAPSSVSAILHILGLHPLLANNDGQVTEIPFRTPSLGDDSLRRVAVIRRVAVRVTYLVKYARGNDGWQPFECFQQA